VTSARCPGAAEVLLGELLGAAGGFKSFGMLQSSCLSSNGIGPRRPFGVKDVPSLPIG
jgi:hypothetical protein